MNSQLDPKTAWQINDGTNLSLAQAAHLYRRATFGANWKTLQECQSAGVQKTVDAMLQPPATLAAWEEQFSKMEVAAIDPLSDETTALRSWYLRRLIESPFPLLERMTFFWVSVFGIPYSPKKPQGRFAHQYLCKIRSHALGSFRSLQEELGRTLEPLAVAHAAWRAFVTDADAPSDAFLVPLEDCLTTQDSVRCLLETIFRSQIFYSPVAYKKRVKSPLDWAMELIRIGESLVPTVALGDDLYRFGEPLEKSSPDGKSLYGMMWLRNFDWISRIDFAASLLGLRPSPYSGKFDFKKVATQYGFHQPEAARRFYISLVLQDDLSDEQRQQFLASSESDNRFVFQLVTSPAFQMG